MVFYIAVVIFHKQHESNHIAMIFYIVVIIYDLIIITLTYCSMLSSHVNPYYFFLKKNFIKTWVKNWIATQGNKAKQDSGDVFRTFSIIFNQFSY